MLLKTYEKILQCFNEAHGYMSFAELKEKKVTILQIRELENEGVLQKFSRGWYWCNKTEWKKPNDYKYVEIAKVDPDAVICMESACYLNGIIKEEPEVISIATSRTDRRKLEFDFAIRRYYLQDAGIEGEIQERSTEFGSYRFYSKVRTYCDCIRMSNEIDEGTYQEVMSSYKTDRANLGNIHDYAVALRALRNIERVDESISQN